MDGREISREEHERRKTDVLEQGGVFMDLDERTGTVKFSFSPEAEERFSKEAAAKGLDFETYMRQVWQEHVDQFMTKEKGKKQP
jgi:hypothetical protein